MLTPTQVQEELGLSTAPQERLKQWARWIDRAYRDVQRRYGDRYSALDSEQVDDVVLRAVAAHARLWRETAEDRYSIQVDDGREERTYSRDPGIFTLPEWVWGELDGPTSTGAFSVDPYYAGQGRGGDCYRTWS